MQLQQLESRLGAAQLALRQSSNKSPGKSQQFTASLASLDALSPSQSMQPSQSIHVAKKLRSDSSQPPASQTNALTQGLGAVDGPAGTSSVPVHSTDHTDTAASQAGEHFEDPGGFHVCDRITYGANGRADVAGHPQAGSQPAAASQEAGAAVAEHEADKEKSRVGQAKIVSRGGRGRGRGRGRLATKIGG